MEKKKIVVASGNKAKIREISEILTDYEIISCKDAGFTGEIIEDGNTFLENALIKAKTVAEALNIPALADDSGICVDALGGAPGIYSARYAGDGDDNHNNELLLKNMQGENNRKAKFVCALVYYAPDGTMKSAIGETHGQILDGIYGTNGFGYDPLFYSDDLKMSMGLADPKEKNKVSHRYRALIKIKEQL